MPETDASHRQPPTKEKIREELEATRQAYHELVASLAEDDWQKMTQDTSWTVGELLVHLAYYLETLPRIIDHAGKGRSFMNMPGFVRNRLNEFYTRRAARKENLQSVVLRYDRAHEAALALVDSVDESLWNKSIPFFGMGEKPVSFLLRIPKYHFRDHAEHIRRVASV